MNFENYYCVESFKQFCNFLDEDEKFLCEVLNTKIKVKRINHPQLDYTVSFTINDDTFTFLAKKLNEDSWSIGFIRNDDWSFKELSSKRFIGDIFSGVFESIRMFLYDTPSCKHILFKSSNDKLKKFYSSNPFKKYLQRHFRLELTYCDDISGEWRYSRNEF